MAENLSEQNDSDLEMENCPPPELREAAARASRDLLPEKSKRLYVKAQGIHHAYTQLKKLCEEIDIDISKYFKVVAFLNKKNVAYKPKKSVVFSKEEIDKLLNEAPDDELLSKKAIVIIGVAGTCRTDELCNMVLDDVDIRDGIILLSIPNSKNGSSSPSSRFVIIEPQWINIVKKYLANRSTDIRKLFILYRKGKHHIQNIGHNTISLVPYVMAQFLKLQHPECYTGHSLWRSSATLLPENRAELLSLKRHGGWKSATVAEGYIEESIMDKKRTAKLVQKPFLSNENLSIPSTSLARQYSLAENLQIDDLVPTVNERSQIIENIHNTEVNFPTINKGNSIKWKCSSTHDL